MSSTPDLAPSPAARVEPADRPLAALPAEPLEGLPLPPHEPAAPAGPSVTLEVADLTWLPRVLEPDVNALHVHRVLPAAWTAACARAAAALDDREVRARVGADGRGLELLMAWLPGDVQAALREDLLDLIPRFAALLRADEVMATVLLDATDGCRRFHCDHVGLRLLCTYAGPGTEWLADATWRRALLARKDLALGAFNQAIAAGADGVRRAGTGDVLVLKGHAWPGNAGRGAIHRSPPVRASRTRRLLVKLDAAPRPPA